MPADLSNPFGPSCCDGGECSTSKESARPCGCDFGTTPPHMCERHQIAAIKSQLKWFLDETEYDSEQSTRYKLHWNNLYVWANE